MKKTLTMSLAALGIAGMVGGGTFAEWSDFTSVGGQRRRSRRLVLTPSAERRTNGWSGSPDRPGRETSPWTYCSPSCGPVGGPYASSVTSRSTIVVDVENGCDEQLKPWTETDGATTSGPTASPLDERQRRGRRVQGRLASSPGCYSGACWTTDSLPALPGPTTPHPVASPWSHTAHRQRLDRARDGTRHLRRIGLRALSLAAAGVTSNSAQGDYAAFDLRFDLDQIRRALIGPGRTGVGEPTVRQDVSASLDDHR